jgi:hypothetical protein
MAHFRLVIILAALALPAAVPILAGGADLVLMQVVTLMPKGIGCSNALFPCTWGSQARHSAL